MKRALFFFAFVSSFTGILTIPNQRVFGTGKHLPDLRDASIEELQEGMRQGHFTSQQLIQAFMTRSESVSHLHAILEFNPHASAQAIERDAIRDLARLEGGTAEERLGLMWGIPVLIKDNIAQSDPLINSTAGSFSLVGSRPRRSATVVQKLEDAGAVILGRTNMDVFANCGLPDSKIHNATSGWFDLSWGWSPRGGQTLSPFNEDGNVCGSSGGSAVAAFLSLAPLVLGTETGWSITCPSNRNNIVGFRPTTGLTSRAGVVPLVNLRDTIGPMVKSVRDAAVGLSVLAGIDPLDDRTFENPIKTYPFDYTEGLEEFSLNGTRIGLLPDSLWNESNIAVKAKDAKQNLIETLTKAGADIVMDVPYNYSVWKEWARSYEDDVANFIEAYDMRHSMDNYLGSLLYSPHHIRSTTNLANFYDTHDEETPDGRNLGCKHLFHALVDAPVSNDTAYLDALAIFQEAVHKFSIERVMEALNLTAVVGVYHVEKGVSGGGATSGMTATFNLPGIVLPAGWWTEEDNAKKEETRQYVYPLDNMPFGIEFMGRRWHEHELLQVGRAYEKLVGGPEIWREDGWKRVRADVKVAPGWG